MSPLILILLSSISLQIAISSSSSSDDDGFAYDSIRIRDESPPRHRFDDLPPRRPRRPLNHGGGSRFLNRRRRPGKKQLDKSNLMVLMGEDYLTSWMSDERPKKPIINVPSNEVNLDEGQGSWAQERLLDQLQSINLTAELSALEPQLLPFEQLVKQWMVKRSSCPVEFTWKDLGPTYWPRWIRKGECANRKGLCSFPTGMHCVPGATTKVMLLFWDCEEAKRRHVRQEPVEGMKEHRNRKTGADQGMEPESLEDQEAGPENQKPGTVVQNRKFSNRSRTNREPDSNQSLADQEAGSKNQRPGTVLKNQVRYRGPVPKLPLSSRRRRSQEPNLGLENQKSGSGSARVRRSPGFDSETSVLYKNRVPHLKPSTHIKKKKRCDWKKVPYPITVDCFCTC